MGIINKSTETLKHLIFAEIRIVDEKFTGMTDEQLNKLLFHHLSGLRLSLTGFIIIKSIFTAYSFELPATLKSKHQRGMANMAYPYFFTKSRLVLFSDMDAMVIKLAGGIEAFLETCTHANL